MLNHSLPALSPVVARQLVMTLRDGVAPNDPITRWLTVGQETLLHDFDLDLAAVAGGEFRRLLLLGNPGAGKSHLLTSLRFLAAERKFITALFSHDLQSKLAFNRPDQIYRSIMATLQRPEVTAGDALSTLLDAWVSQALPQLRGVRRSMMIAWRLSEVGLLPRETLQIHPRTRVALVGYVMATEQQNDEARRQFLSVLQGPGLTNGHLLQVARSIRLERKAWIGYTPGVHDASYYFGQLRTVTYLTRSVGYPGLVVLFDEVTSIVDLGASSRDKAYRVLDSLFFNNYGYEGLYLVFAYMPPFIEQLRDDRSRVGEDYVTRWADLLRERTREIAPVNRQQRAELLRRLALLHGLARSWDAWGATGSGAAAFVQSLNGSVAPVRDLVRRWLAHLEANWQRQR